MDGRKHGTELDGLRLIGLGRIDRCATCPRYRSLVNAYMNGGSAARRLAPVPADCEQAYCTPLAVRYGLDESSPARVLRAS